MSTIATKCGTLICHKDWVSGPTIVFSHGWPLDSDSWESQMVLLASHGHGCVEDDRRGHVRSNQLWYWRPNNRLTELIPWKWHATDAATGPEAIT